MPRAEPNPVRSAWLVGASLPGGALNAVLLGLLHLELGLQRGFDAGDGTLWSQLASRILYLRWQVWFHLSDVGWWTSLLLFVMAPWLAVALAVVPAQTRSWRIVIRTSVLAAGTWFVLEMPALHHQATRPGRVAGGGRAAW